MLTYYIGFCKRAKSVRTTVPILALPCQFTIPETWSTPSHEHQLPSSWIVSASKKPPLEFRFSHHHDQRLGPRPSCWRCQSNLDFLGQLSLLFFIRCLQAEHSHTDFASSSTTVSISLRLIDISRLFCCSSSCWACLRYRKRETTMAAMVRYIMLSLCRYYWIRIGEDLEALSSISRLPAPAKNRFQGGNSESSHTEAKPMCGTATNPVRLLSYLSSSLTVLTPEDKRHSWLRVHQPPKSTTSLANRTTLFQPWFYRTKPIPSSSVLSPLRLCVVHHTLLHCVNFEHDGHFGLRLGLRL